MPVHHQPRAAFCQSGEQRVMDEAVSAAACAGREPRVEAGERIDPVARDAGDAQPRHVALTQIDPAAGVADRALIVGGHDRGGGDHRLVSFGEHRPGKPGDRAAVIAAAQLQPRRRGEPADAACDRFAEDVAVSFYIIRFIATEMRGVGGGGPIALEICCAGKCHGEAVAAGEAGNAGEQRLAGARVHCVDQYPADHRMGQVARYVGQRP